MDGDVPLIRLTDNVEQESPSFEMFKLYSEYAIGIGVNYNNVDEAYIAAARQAGFLVHPCTVDGLIVGEVKILGSKWYLYE